jgi:FkbM family methyltransferase
MGSWKVSWVKGYVFSKEVYQKNKTVLKSPLSFYIAVFFKLIPGLYKKPIRLRLKEGGSFFCPDFMSVYIYWEIFLFNVYDFQASSKDEITILDVGANIGLSTIHFKQRFPLAEVLCFEPFKPNFDFLNINILNSNYKNIKTFQMGLAGEKRHSLLYIHKKNSGAHSIYPEELSFGSVEIDLIDLHQALSMTKAGKCDILKLDCEGAEYEIIKSITPDLAKSISQIYYEATVTRYDPKELNDYLSSIGYQVDLVGGYVYSAKLTK